MAKHITSFSMHTQTESLILGDFNAKINPQTLTPLSRNGRLLSNLLRHTGLQMVNGTSACTGQWTRQDTSGRKSILDYALCSPPLLENIRHMLIDEEGHYRLRSKVPTDHNTILIALDVQIIIKPPTQTVSWNIYETTDWGVFEEAIKDTLSTAHEDTGNNIQRMYDSWERQIIQAAKVSIGYRVSKRGTPISKSKSVKLARMQKKAAKSAFNKYKSTKDPTVEDPERDRLYTEYRNKHDALLQVIQKEETERAQRTVKMISEDGGVNSKKFWTLRRQVMRANVDDMSCLRNTKGEYIHEKEEVLHYVHEYFTDLYSPNTSRYYNPCWAEFVNSLVQRYSVNQDYEELQYNQSITRQEIETVIKSLPNGKTPGPDTLIYEFFKYGGNVMKDSLHTIMAKIFDEEVPPKQWQESLTTCIPKGKKNPELLENKRALTLASNAEKFFERILINRVECYLLGR